MSTFIDQTGHKISLATKPVRIISVVPSQSEFLWDIGLKEQLVGITKFCIHPSEMFRAVERVGGTKNLNLEKIRALKPDLIIANKEENEKIQIEALQNEFNVWMSDIYNFDDAFEMMRTIGEMTDKKAEAQEIVNEIERSLPSIKNIFSKEKVLYFIWNEPYMLAAKNTYIDHVLNYIGLTNSANSLLRYPKINAEELKKIKPDICFLSSEPFPFKEKHADEIKRILPGVKTKIVDGEMFSWYGSRLLKLADYVKELKKSL